MKISDSVLLSKHTSFRTGGPASFFVEVHSVDDLRHVLGEVKSRKVPYLILGEGSNVLISDAGVPGYVIRPMMMGKEISEDGLLIAGSGEHWDDVVAFSVTKGFSGIENLSWIPGSAGAAPVQNIGAYGTELKDVLEWVEVFDPESDSVKMFSGDECFFGYRHSLFKTPAGRDLIIIRIALKLAKNGTPNISYRDLKFFFDGKAVPSIAEVRDAVIHIRQAKLPDIAKLGTAGSFFTNPIVSGVEYTRLLETFPGLPAFPSGDSDKKIPLAWILDKVCGLNGFREGNVGLYDTQPLALVNYGDATTDEIKKFAQKISGIVKEKTGLEIEWEVNMI